MDIVVCPHLFEETRKSQDLIYTPLLLSLYKTLNVTGSVFFINPNSFTFPGTGAINVAADYASKDLEKFRKSYKHMSSNGYIFERGCFERFFVLRDSFKSLGIVRAFVIENDVMLCRKVDQIFESKAFNNGDWLIQKKCIGTAIVGIEFLEQFCDEALLAYQSPDRLKMLEDWYMAWKNPDSAGGVCDMSFGYWLATGAVGFRKLNIQDICEPCYEASEQISCFDNSLSTSNIGSLSVPIKLRSSSINGWQSKAIEFENGVPFCETLDGRKIRMNSLHFQGRAKAMIGHAIMFFLTEKTGILA